MNNNDPLSYPWPITVGIVLLVGLIILLCAMRWYWRDADSTDGVGSGEDRDIAHWLRRVLRVVLVYFVLALTLISSLLSAPVSTEYAPQIVYEQKHDFSSMLKSETMAYFAVQPGIIQFMSVATIGFIIVYLKRKDETPIARAQVGDTSLATDELTGNIYTLLEMDETYTIEVSYQIEQPESYDGAHCDFTETESPVEFEAVIEGTCDSRMDISRSCFNLRAAPGQHITIEITPDRATVTNLRIAFHTQQGEWVTQLDIPICAVPKSYYEVIKALSPEIQAELLWEDASVAEASINLPAPLQKAVPRHLCLKLAYAPHEKPGYTYTARARTDNECEWREIDIALSEDDLAELSVMLAMTLNTVRRTFEHWNKMEIDALDSEDARVCLDDLARAGHVAFKKIFARQEDRQFVREALRQSEVASLEISSDRFFLPWELLYDEYDQKAVSFSNFWGMRHNISRVLTDVRQYQPPVMRQTGPRIALFANPELEHVREVEVPYFRKLDEKALVTLWDWLKDKAPDTEKHTLEQERSAFIQYSRERESEMLHFACHAVTDPVYSGWSYLDLSSRLQVRLDDLAIEDHLFGGQPVVFLNACGTGVRDPRKTSDFVRQFMQRGARGVLATECDVPDEFASRFVQHLYNRILKGETFGSALLAARRHFWEKHRNPLGLMYAAYTRLETQIQPAEDSAAQA